jgi:alkaline phosphatase
LTTALHDRTPQNVIFLLGDGMGGGDLLRAPTGYSTNLLTKDGQTMSLTYGTAGYGGPGVAPVAVPPSQQHTGAVVPVWASGPGSLDVLGTNDHTDLFQTLGG